MKKMMFAALVSACAIAPTWAHEAGEFFVRVGAASVQPNASSGTVLGGGVDVEDATGLGFSGTYFFSPRVAVEVLAALPFSHDIVGTGALNGVNIGSTKHLPPTVSLQFYPFETASVKPYVGIGLNYTTFFEESAATDLEQALAGDVKIGLDDSTGVAYQLGMDWAINDKWNFNAAIWKVDIDTTATIKLNGATAAKVDVEIDPTVIMLGVSFKY